MIRDVGAPKRILWLLNHTTLRECELPLLQSLGYEVYTPKRFPRNSDNRSASVTYDFDHNLTLPEDVVSELNSYDFYNMPSNPRVKFLLNYYFETAIVAYMFPMITETITIFKGRVLLRAFGLTDPRYSYYSFANLVAGPHFEAIWRRASQRFWFAAGYPNLAEIEPNFMQERTAFVPVGLPDRVLSKRDTWRGGNKRIMFVCPDINSYSEAKQVYKEFKKDFGDFPHIICGSQTIPVLDDPNVVGRLDDIAYEKVYMESAVMYYHSRLPRHIHYHPAEAATYGMPLVYMKEGMLGTLGGDRQAGACETVAEARRKIKSLLEQSDENLKNQILIDQTAIVDYFSDHNVRQHWQVNFVSKVMETPLPPTKPLKIAVITLDTGQETAKVALEIADGMASIAAAEASSVVLGIDSVQRRLVSRRSTKRLSVREFRWIVGDTDKLAIAEEIAGFKRGMQAEPYSLPEDEMGRFMDCDVWILVGDPSSVAVAPLRPSIQVPMTDTLSITERKFSIRRGSDFNVVANLHHASAVADVFGGANFLCREFAARAEKFLPVDLVDQSRKMSVATGDQLRSIAGAIA